MRIKDCNFIIGKRVLIMRQVATEKWRPTVEMIHSEKENKSERRMPRLPEAMKDVVSCEKLRGSANRN